jgi:signal peptidase II
MTRRRAVIFAAILTLTTLFDQGSKAWARGLPVAPAGCTVGDPRCHGVPQPVIAGYWDWELAFNDGAAFSNLRGARGLLALIAGIAVIALIVSAARSKPEQRLRRVALAMIAGGALGNLIDRVRDGAVTDFVRWRIHDHLWPIFNVADVALLIGVGLLLVEGLVDRRRQVVVPAT